jgi:hypothetical protein
MSSEFGLGILFTFDYFSANAHVMLCLVKDLVHFMNPRCISYRFQKITTLETDSLETIDEIFSTSVWEVGRGGIIVAYAGCI